MSSPSGLSKLLPSIPQVLLYWFVGLLFLLLYSYQTILKLLGGEALEKIGGINYLTEGRDYYLDNIFGLPILGTIAVVLFWASIGCSLYCLVWFLSNSAKEAKKYNEAAGYVKPTGYKAANFWGTNLSEIILLLTSIVMLFVLTIAVFGAFLPASDSLLLVLLNNESWQQTLYAVLILLGGWFVIGHLYYLLLHIFNYSRKVVFF